MTQHRRLRAPASLLALTLGLAAAGAVAPVPSSRATAQEAQGKTPGCYEERTTDVGFTGGGDLDTVTTTVIGPTCNDAVVVLVVRDATGLAVYEDVWPVFWFTDNNGAAPDAATIADTVRPRIDGFMADQLPASEVEGPNQWLEVPGPYFDSLRARGGAILCYETGHESGSCAAFDADQRHGVRVLSSGV